ncbi:hypothetical protein niasHT_022915 [Heterodera trifolii]|uniref:Serpin domain-containing protein n=1 Tax=Heterodera trifolii TaxID=157864 RepID=A0ABD2JYG1_9BILA
MTSPPPPNAPLILEAQANFALKLLREVSTEDRSCIVSPFSVAVTFLVLINALYFKGTWAAKFYSKSTKKATFHMDANNKKEVAETNIGKYDNIAKKPLLISKMVQKAIIEVNEEGTVAAAVAGAAYEGPRTIRSVPF